MYFLKNLLLIIASLTVFLTTNSVNCQFLAGGQKQVDLNDLNKKNEMVNWAKFGVNEISKLRRKDYGNERLNFNLIRVLEASTQVVAGINYRIKFRMKDSYCRMNCAVEICNVRIYHKAWENVTELSEHECKSEKIRKLYALGKYEDVSKEKDEVVKAVNYAINDANFRSNQANYFKLKKILTAKHQLVSGSNYNIEFEIEETNCKKVVGISDSQKCQSLENVKSVLCNVDILDQPWMPSRYKLTRSECEF
jgi:hypothetical protein